MRYGVTVPVLLLLSTNLAMSAQCPDLATSVRNGLSEGLAAATVMGPSTSATKPTIHVPVPDGGLDTVTISLARTECLGRCPVYSVTIKGDGAATYAGRMYVLVTGTHDFKVRQADVRCLLEDFRKADFWSMKGEYIADITDLPQHVVTLSIGGQTKTVLDYGGIAIGMPGVITALEDEIDRVAADRWTRGNDDTVADLRAEKLDFHSEAAASILVNGAAVGAPDQLILDLLAAGTAPTGRASGSGWRPGLSAIEAASGAGRTAIVEALIAKGALTAALPGVKEAALRGAASSGNPQIVSDILATKPDVNARDRGGDTALNTVRQAFVYSRDKSKIDILGVTRLLIEAGADPNIANYSGDTPLFSAKDAKVVEMLVQAGGKPNVQDRFGGTPLLSAETDDAAVALIRAGADTTEVTKFGDSIQKLAVRKKYTKTMSLLSHVGPK